MTDKGWIALSRKIQDHWIWTKEKPFDQRSAWIDLLLQANHKANRFPLGTEMVEVGRGSFITSERKLGDRWGWSNTKVRNFLKLLENDNMITKFTDSKKSTITIVNYSVYQDLKSTEKAEEQQNESTGKADEHTNNNDKTMNNNENKDNYNIVELPSEASTTPKFSSVSFEMLCVETIIHSCLEVYPNSKTPSTQNDKNKWAVEIDRMKRLDNRSEDEIKQALQFAVNDSFWKENIRSAKKFREKFETLLIQSKGKKSVNKSVNRQQQLQDDFVKNMEGFLNEHTGIC